MGYKVLSLSILSIILLFIDDNSTWLDLLKQGMTTVAEPMYFIADFPAQISEDVTDAMSTQEEMQKEINVLRRDLLLLKGSIQKMEALTAENIRLRDLLGSAVKLEEKVVIAELIGVNPDPEKHEVIIDKGARDGVFVQQSVLDARGLIGQVVETGSFTSRILLISDRSHSVPVQVARSNLRLIAQGIGLINELEVIYVQDTADIEVGDLLVSSGLGDRFPVGYPVAVVSSIKHDPGQPFATVKAKPRALLDRSRHVLLVFSEDKLAERVEVEKDGKGA